jgi:hypothetical protein
VSAFTAVKKPADLSIVQMFRATNFLWYAKSAIAKRIAKIINPLSVISKK